MGLAQEALAVAGIDGDSFAERFQPLASGDWSRFNPTEQAAFTYAYKLVKAPADIVEQDLLNLVHHFEMKGALEVILWVCECVHKATAKSVWGVIARRGEPSAGAREGSRSNEGELSAGGHWNR
jgi:hypothetical protein